ncbi:MAG TPA: M50 family metallopeptidase [Longimicrobiales bacterium]|nr:M50 family metallopeptidase [Longimicrobiales bacterium]
MKERTRRKALFVAGFAVYFAALWLLWYTPIIYPLKLFVVLAHEVSHGLMAMATGGTIQRIVITPDQGGMCQCPGGNPFLTLSAGYMGSLGWGALLVLAARSKRPAPRTITTILGVGILLLTAFYVRNTFGILFGALFGAGLVAVRGLPRGVHVALLNALGLTSCLYALLDIKSDVIDRPYLHSDAYMLAQMTGVPALLWGILWILAGLAVSWLLLRTAYESS